MDVWEMKREGLAEGLCDEGESFWRGIARLLRPKLAV
jgi:hypothetical protein